MELIPYLMISVLNGCIMFKIYRSYKFRRQFLRSNNEQQVPKGLQRISPNSPRNNGGKIVLLHHDVLYMYYSCYYIWYHTVRKSQIVSKNSIFKKIAKSWIWIFVPKSNEVLWVLYNYTLISIRIWISRQNCQNSTILYFC